MDSFKRAGKAHKSASRKALLKAGCEEQDIKTAGSGHRCMSKSKIVKGRTIEEQERIDADNAAIAATVRKNAEAVLLEQQTRKRDLTKKKPKWNARMQK